MSIQEGLMYINLRKKLEEGVKRTLNVMPC